MIQFMISAIVVVVFLAIFGPTLATLLVILVAYWPVVLGVSAIGVFAVVYEIWLKDDGERAKAREERAKAEEERIKAEEARAAADRYLMALMNPPREDEESARRRIKAAELPPRKKDD